MDWDEIKPVIIIGVIVVVITFGLYFLLRGCKGIQQDVAHVKSSYVGLERKVTLFANDGSIIKTWKGNYKVDIDEACVRFIDDGKVIELNGTFIVEEIK
jgi:hypothetical protein